MSLMIMLLGKRGKMIQ